MSLGLVAVDVSRKVSDFWGPCFQKILVLNFGWVLTFGSDLAKCNENGLGKRGSHSFGYETLGSGMRWAGGQRQN